VLFKLLKLFLGVACLGAFAWWAFTVPLGKRTLWEHGLAIGKSKESKELVQGTKDKVSDLKSRIIPGAEAAKKPEKAAKAEKPGKAAQAGHAREHLSNADRQEMLRLLDSARSKADTGHTIVR
jgi:hypothetical protein